MAFYPGQKIVAVGAKCDSHPPDYSHNGSPPKETRTLPFLPLGNIFTVREHDASISKFPRVRLVGIIGGKVSYGEEAYCAYCFKPAVEQDENITEAIKLFREIAADPAKKIGAKA